MPTFKKQSGIRFDDTVYDKIKFIAQQENRSLNAQLEYLSKLYIEEYEGKNGEIILAEEDG